MNEGTIKEIKLEKGKTLVKINFDLKYEGKEDDKVVCKNIFIYLNDKDYIPIFIDQDENFTVGDMGVCALLNKKCVFELDLNGVIIKGKDADKDKYTIDSSKLKGIKIKSISLKAD